MAGSAENVAYDTGQLGEPGQPGVPQGDQRPKNDRNEESVVADVNIPGPQTSESKGSMDKAVSFESTPEAETREAKPYADQADQAEAESKGEAIPPGSAGAGDETPQTPVS